MNRRKFLTSSMAAGADYPLRAVAKTIPLIHDAAAATEGTRVAVLVVDTDRASVSIDPRIYGQFLEHINHSVEDGLFAEQVRGAGFEGDDFKTYWEPVAERGRVALVDQEFQNGRKSVRLQVEGGHAAIRQGRFFFDAGVAYEGSLWVKRERGTPQLTLRVQGAHGEPIASVPLRAAGSAWQEVRCTFTSPLRSTQASVEIAAAGNGQVLLDFVSLMRVQARRDGMLRPDLYQSVAGLQPSFIRWPGGSFASTYRWKEGIGPYPARGYHPNTYWGGYSDYYGFGTDEFLGLCHRLGAEPLIVLPAQGTSADQVDYAMDWVRYVNDPPDTEWGRKRAANGHPAPYAVRYFQIDNEPMNNGFTAEAYAAIVNVYGSRLRSVAQQARIVACGQKRSSDMDWSETVIDLAGAHFDILGCHNYEYEPANFETGLRRIRDYLVKLGDYVRVSKHPHIEIAVLEWSLQHTYDWRAGLHAAGSLMLYEELSPSLTMTCPALLMRNTSDDPKWTAAIYHDHVSWFPGGSYSVEKLFREHYAEQYLASATGTFADVANRKLLFDKISTVIPEGWTPGSVDAIATASADGHRLVIKAVNYEAKSNTLLVRLKGAAAPEAATATLHTITAAPGQTASMEHPEAIATVSRPLAYGREFTVVLDPYSVAVVDIRKA